MPIILTVKTDDPQVEKLFGFLRSEFPTLDDYNKAEVLKRCIEWLKVRNNNDSIFNFDGKNESELHFVINDLPSPDSGVSTTPCVQESCKQGDVVVPIGRGEKMTVKPVGEQGKYLSRVLFDQPDKVFGYEANQRIRWAFEIGKSAGWKSAQRPKKANEAIG